MFIQQTFVYSIFFIISYVSEIVLGLEVRMVNNTDKDLVFQRLAF